MVGPAAKRAAVAHLEAEMGLSERRACSIVGADRKMIVERRGKPSSTVSDNGTEFRARHKTLWMRRTLQRC